jgi:hypothetical protein
MKNIFFIFVLFSLQVFGSYLIVDDESLASASTSDGTVQLNSFQQSSMALQINQASGELTIPIYVKTDSTDAIHMNLDSISPLKNSANETIDTTISFKPNSSDAITISANNDFTIHSGSPNDGTSKVGDIIIKVANVPALATYGTYSLSSNAKVKIDSSGSYSSPNTLNSTATVAKVAMVNIGDSSDVSDYKTGVDFKDSTIGFGNFQLNQTNSITKNVFVKSNTTGDIALSFDTTQKLKHIQHDSYQIGMSYFYTKTGDSEQSVQNNTNFTIYSDKNDGTTKVGEMRFSTETLTGSLIAGGYSASIAVTVTAQ